MSSRRHLTVVTAIFTLALMAWAIVEIIRNGVTLWLSAVLVYLVLVSVTVWLRRGETLATALSPPTTLQTEEQGESGQSEKTAREIILETIRTKGKAQRHNLLPQIGLSRSNLGRLLDQMEAQGLIRQVGERKSSYYVLAKK